MEPGKPTSNLKNSGISNQSQMMKSLDSNISRPTVNPPIQKIPSAIEQQSFGSYQSGENNEEEEIQNNQSIQHFLSTIPPPPWQLPGSQLAKEQKSVSIHNSQYIKQYQYLKEIEQKKKNLVNVENIAVHSQHIKIESTKQYDDKLSTSLFK